MRNHIENYTGRGWHLLPLRPNEKKPMLPDWVNACSADMAVVMGWLQRSPQMNLGAACGVKSGFFVVDVDKKADGLKTYGRVQTSPNRFPPTLMQRTAGGGLHLLYRTSEDFSPGNRKLDKLGLTGIEARGQGGQIVVAPSAVDGVPYAWDGSSKIVAARRAAIETINRGFDKFVIGAAQYQNDVHLLGRAADHRRIA